MRQTQPDTVRPREVGNTSNLSRCRKWVFTINNPEINSQTLENIFNDICIKYIWQLEEGEEGTPHYQGYLEFKNPRNFSYIKKLIPTAHIEKCNNSNAAIEYCRKTEGRLETPVYKGVRKPLKDPLDGKILRPFQKEILELIKTEPDDRTIHWYWDRTGNIGKSSLCKHIAMNYGEKAMCLTGKASDMKYGIATHIKQEKELDVVMFDYTRSMESYISYQGIEEIKNGHFYSTKYESESVLFNSPHVIIFANFAPDKGAMSNDRWKVTEIGS